MYRKEMKGTLLSVLLFVLATIFVDVAFGDENEVDPFDPNLYHVGYFACFENVVLAQDNASTKITDFCFEKKRKPSISAARTLYCSGGGYQLVVTYQCINWKE